MNTRVIKTPELEVVLQFAKSQIEAESSDPFEAELASWKAPWRRESLEHYLSLGWSFGVWDDEQSEELKGFCLAQPLLFYQGLTQSLWIESIVAANEQVSTHLLETCYKWARDKHLQQLVFSLDIQRWLLPELENKSDPIQILSIPTAKIRKN